jgi:hypothetical protein
MGRNFPAENHIKPFTASAAALIFRCVAFTPFRQGAFPIRNRAMLTL